MNQRGRYRSTQTHVGIAGKVKMISSCDARILEGQIIFR